MKTLGRKAEIIEKATDLFFKDGFVKASVRDIVKAVGITNSTVYIHFKNKDEILYNIIEDIGSTLLKELGPAFEANPDDPVECLQEMVYRQVCLIKEKRREIKIYMEEQYQLPTPLRKRALKQHREIYDLYYNTIVKIKEKGLMRDINETVMTFGIFAMMNWAYRWVQDEGSLSIEQIAQDIIRIFFGGIFKEGRIERD